MHEFVSKLELAYKLHAAHKQMQILQNNHCAQHPPHTSEACSTMLDRERERDRQREREREREKVYLKFQQVLKKSPRSSEEEVQFIYVRA